MDVEKEFMRFIADYPQKVLKGIEIVAIEQSLYRPGQLLSRDFYSIENYEKERMGYAFGIIDLVFKYKGKLYCGAVKHQRYKNGDFWDAMKVLGYCTYYKWQIETMGRGINIIPAIIMPTNKINLEHKIIAGRLGITLFGIKREKGSFEMENISSKRITASEAKLK